MISANEIRNSIIAYKLKQVYESGETSMFDKELDREKMRKQIEELTGESLYIIYYCFTTADGMIQTDDYGCEEYFDEEIWAESEEKAVEKFKKYFDNRKMDVEIVDIIKR